MKNHSVLFKIAAMCMAVILLVSTFGVVAYADDEGPECPTAPEGRHVFEVLKEGANSTTHVKKCSYCNKTVKDEHDWVFTALAGEAQADGTIFYYHVEKCSLCDVEKANSKKPCNMTLEKDGAGKVLCTDTQHRYSCSDCNRKLDENHDFETVFFAKEDGTYYHIDSCKVCGYLNENSKEKCVFQYKLDENGHIVCSAEGHILECVACKKEITLKDEADNNNCTNLLTDGTPVKKDNLVNAFVHSFGEDPVCQGPDINGVYHHALVCNVENCTYVQNLEACTIDYDIEDPDGKLPASTDEYHYFYCPTCHGAVAEKHNFILKVDEEGNDEHNENTHILACFYCGRTKEEKHTFADNPWYTPITDANGNIIRDCDAIHCIYCSYFKQQEACDFSTHYQGFNEKGHRYHTSECTKCNHVKDDGEECNLVYVPDGNLDNPYHLFTCTECHLSYLTGNGDEVSFEEYSRCTWGEWSHKTPIERDASVDFGSEYDYTYYVATPVNDTNEHHIYCTICGQLVKSENHNYKWKSKDNQTLFKGNDMTWTCWCGAKGETKNAEKLWSEDVRESQGVTVDDLSYLHRLGLWVLGTGSFVLRVAFEPVRLFVNLFYHLDIFD